MSKASTLSMKFYYTPEFIGENAVKFTFMESDGQAATMAYYDSEEYSGVKHIIDGLMDSYKISSPSMLAPVRMNFTSTTNPESVVVLNTKHW